MISLVHAPQSSLSTVVIIFYTCIWIPLLHMKKTLFEIAAGFVFYTYHWPETKPDHQERNLQLVDFSAVRFQDLEGSREEEEEGEMCSVCLVEFEREDLVSQLHRCGHLFHMKCIQGWLDRNNFTCPLCRSLLLAACKS